MTQLTHPCIGAPRLLVLYMSHFVTGGTHSDHVSRYLYFQGNSIQNTHHRHRHRHVDYDDDHHHDDHAVQ